MCTLMDNTSDIDTFIIILHKISDIDDGYDMCYSLDKFKQIIRGTRIQSIIYI